ncbi:MAG: dihydroorotate dehydrogenase electron transfer subunit [Candidatus Margulisiibacteriota bacterium]
MIQERARVIDHKKLTANYFLLTLSSAHISKNAQPGQFVNVKVSDDIAPLLRRPISIHQTDPKNNNFKLLYEVVGPGTKKLSEVKPGQEISVLGPLGTGFRIEKNIAILIAGGMGIAPLCFLIREASKQAKELHVFIGAKTKDLVLCEDGIKALGAKVYVTTEDGSKGKKGLPTAALDEFLKNNMPATIYACGPKAMLIAVSLLSEKYKVPCQISMETYMACGIGACKGCAVETNEGYKMVCKDGPVFNAEDIKW